MKKATFLCGLLRENGRTIVCLIQNSYPFSPKPEFGFQHRLLFIGLIQSRDWCRYRVATGSPLI